MHIVYIFGDQRIFALNHESPIKEEDFVSTVGSWIEARIQLAQYATMIINNIDIRDNSEHDLENQLALACMIEESKLHRDLIKYLSPERGKN